MKKKFSAILLASIAFGSMITSCSQDENFTSESDNQLKTSETRNSSLGILVDDALEGIWVEANIFRPSGKCQVIQFGNNDLYRGIVWIGNESALIPRRNDGSLVSFPHFITSFSSTEITFKERKNNDHNMGIDPNYSSLQYYLSENKDTLYAKTIFPNNYIPYVKVPNRYLRGYFEKQLFDIMEGTWVSQPLKFADNSREVYRFTAGNIEVSAVSEHSTNETIMNLPFTNAKSACLLERVSLNTIDVTRNNNSSNRTKMRLEMSDDRKSFILGKGSMFPMTFTKIEL